MDHKTLNTHFFINLPRKHKTAWRNYYTGQNLSSVKTASAIFFVLNIVIRVLYLAFPVSLTKAENFPEFDITNWVFMGSSLIFYVTAYLAIEVYVKKHEATAIMALFVFIFSLYIIGCGIYSSFIATGDPRNALILYLIALTIISVLCILENYETIILIISAEILFTLMLAISHTGPTEMIYNQLISAVLLGCFYLVSRYFFSSKANYFLQLMEIRDKNQEIERNSELKSQLLGMVAHDLRNPIAAVESIAMLMEMDDINADTRENLEMMKASCVKARTIIEDLLETARNENTSEFITQKTELNKFISDIIEVWKPQNTTKDIELTSRAIPVYAKINNEKFQRVMDNLIGNALKFSKEQSKVAVIVTKDGSHVIIEVKDSGIGIPKDKLPIIFDPFTKAGRAGLKGEQSTGLGLSIVKQIIEKHGGQIEVESEEGKGSTFRILLRLVD